MSSSTPSTTGRSASGCTDVSTKHFTYEWIVKKFSLLPQDNKEYIYSPIFRMVDNEVEWKLSLYPQGESENCADYVSIFLHPHSLKAERTKIKVQCKLSILQTRGSKRFVYTYLYGTKAGHGFPKMIKRTELLKSIAPEDEFSIRCTIDIPREIITEPIDIRRRMKRASDSQEGQLSHDFRPLLKKSKLSDFAVIVGKEKLPAHKVVLAARSPVFSAMFEHEETQENVINEVKIERMEPAIVDAMLEFFYTDQVTNIEELAYGLLEAADRYDVPRLRTMCEEVFYKTLNKENAAEILVHADLYHSHELKVHVLIFIADHLLDVLQSDGYKEIKNLELMKELLFSVAVRKGSNE